MTAEKVPLRPASPIDAELAKPHPEEMTEIEREKERPVTGANEKAKDEQDLARVEAERERSDRRPI
jgi:hypothetical protein